MIAGVAHFR